MSANGWALAGTVRVNQAGRGSETGRNSSKWGMHSPSCPLYSKDNVGSQITPLARSPEPKLDSSRLNSLKDQS